MLIYDSLLTVEQDGFELCRFTYMGFFPPNKCSTINVFSLIFLIFSLA